MANQCITKRYRRSSKERTKSVGLTPQNSIFARMTTDNKGQIHQAGQRNVWSLAEWEEKIQEVKANAQLKQEVISCQTTEHNNYSILQ
jgi:hypothetical protein